MGIQLRIVNAPARLVSVPKPIALRYLAKDEKGFTHICQRTCAKPAQFDASPAPVLVAAQLCT
jgi:hypothetical protein